MYIHVYNMCMIQRQWLIFHLHGYICAYIIFDLLSHFFTCLLCYSLTLSSRKSDASTTAFRFYWEGNNHSKSLKILIAYFLVGSCMIYLQRKNSWYTKLSEEENDGCNNFPIENASFGQFNSITCTQLYVIVYYIKSTKSIIFLYNLELPLIKLRWWMQKSYSFKQDKAHKV